jgi:Cof subfamily protein (haloacid dehalogenase superfamily)
MPRLPWSQLLGYRNLESNSINIGEFVNTVVRHSRLSGVLPRLIATDLDGTLLNSYGELSARTIAALRAAHAAGMIVVFATGRPPMVAHREVSAVGHAVRYGVMANGSMICSLPDGESLYTIGFPSALAVEAIARLRAHDTQFGFALATDRGFTQEVGFTERMPVHRGGDSVDDVLTGHEGATEAIKLLAFHHHHSALELLDIIPPIVGSDLVVSHMGTEAVELGPAGADKGAGLRWLCAYLDIDAADVLVFGDEVNDLAMFRFAGRSVAVANAAAPVRAAATHVTASNDDDGVATFIEALLSHLD